MLRSILGIQMSQERVSIFRPWLNIANSQPLCTPFMWDGPEEEKEISEWSANTCSGTR